MEKIGYRGGGLGVDGQGRQAPLDVEIRDHRGGLGFSAHKLRSISSGLEDGPWFLNTDYVSEHAWLANSFSAPPTAEEVKTWDITIARPLTTILSSKFCRQEIIINLQVQRRDKLVGIIPFVRTESKACEAASKGIIANATALAYKTKQNEEDVGEGGRTFAVEGIEMMQLERVVGFFQHVPVSSSVACVLHHTLVGYAPFFVRKGCKRVIVPDDPLLATHSCASSSRITKFTAQQPLFGNVCHSERKHTTNDDVVDDDVFAAGCADIVVGGVHLDPRTQVCGVANDVTIRHCKHEILDHMMVGLFALKEGGTFILVLPDVLTRFSASCVFILWRCFREMRVMKPFSCSPACNSRFVAFRGYLGVSQCTPCLAHVEQAYSLLQQSSVDNHASSEGADENDVELGREGFISEETFDVLSIVTPTLMLKTSFLQHLTRTNERHLQREVAAIASLQPYAEIKHGDAAEGGSDNNNNDDSGNQDTTVNVNDVEVQQLGEKGLQVIEFGKADGVDDGSE
eukprot:m.8026 g.8026  ORF g.8026 m.8026 type:complete len:514 (+) comp2989_c0_seq1:2-1543(+)